MSGGRLKIQVFAGGELMPPFGCFDATSQGTIEAFMGAPYYWAGKDAGFRTVGVATGNYSLEQLRTAGANIAISDFQQGHDHFLRSAFME